MPQAALRPPPMLPPGGPPGPGASKEQKRAWREANAEKQEWYREAAGQGFSLAEINRIYSTALNGGRYDPEYGRTREHGGVPMQAMWNQWNAYGGGLPLGYTFDWMNGKMRHDATSDADPNSPTGNQTWQDIPQAWQDQYNQFQQWKGSNQDKIQQSGGDAYAAYLRQWTDYYKPGYQRPDAPTGLAGPSGVGPQGGGAQQFGASSMPFGVYGSMSGTPSPFQSGPNFTPGWPNLPTSFPGFPGGSPFGGFPGFPGGGSGSPYGGGASGMMTPNMDRIYGNIGNITGELGKQAGLDTGMQRFNLQRQVQEYGEGRGMEDYVRDLYGDILGVQFGNEEFDMGPYFDQSMQAGNGAGLPANLWWKQGNTQYPWPQDPNNPNTTPPTTNPDGTPANPNAPQSPNVWTKVLDENGNPRPYVPWWDKTNPNHPDNYAAGAQGQGQAQMGSQGGGVVQFDDLPDSGPTELPGGGDPSQETGGPGVPGGGGAPYPGGPNGEPKPWTGAPWGPPPGTTTGTDGGPAGNPAGPGAPGLPRGSYRMVDSRFDPSNSRSWGMLARPAQEIAADLDSQRAILARMMPAGGERNLAEADALNSSFGKIGGLRQGLVSEALSGISNMGQSKKFQVPMGGMSGSGQSLLGNYMQGRGQDLSHSLGLSQIRSNESIANKIPWGGIFQSIGGGLADLLSGK